MDSKDIILIVGSDQQFSSLSEAIQSIPTDSNRVQIVITSDLIQGVDVIIPIDKKNKYIKITSSDENIHVIDFLGCSFFTNGIPIEIDSTINLSNCFLFGGSKAETGQIINVEKSQILLNGKVDYLFGGGYAIGRNSISNVSDVLIQINEGQVSHLYGGGYSVQQGSISSKDILIQISSNGIVDNLYGGSCLPGPNSQSIIQTINLKLDGKVTQNIYLGGYAAFGSSIEINERVHIDALKLKITGNIFDKKTVGNLSKITIGAVDGCLSTDYQDHLKIENSNIEVIRQIEEIEETTINPDYIHKNKNTLEQEDTQSPTEEIITESKPSEEHEKISQADKPTKNVSNDSENGQPFKPELDPPSESPTETEQVIGQTEEPEQDSSSQNNFESDLSQLQEHVSNPEGFTDPENKGNNSQSFATPEQTSQTQKTAEINQDDAGIFHSQESERLEQTEVSGIVDVNQENSDSMRSIDSDQNPKSYSTEMDQDSPKSDQYRDSEEGSLPENKNQNENSISKWKIQDSEQSPQPDVSKKHTGGFVKPFVICLLLLFLAMILFFIIGDKNRIYYSAETENVQTQPSKNMETTGYKTTQTIISGAIKNYEVDDESINTPSAITKKEITSTVFPVDENITITNAMEITISTSTPIPSALSISTAIPTETESPVPIPTLTFTYVISSLSSTAIPSSTMEKPTNTPTMTETPLPSVTLTPTTFMPSSTHTSVPSDTPSLPTSTPIITASSLPSDTKQSLVLPTNSETSTPTVMPEEKTRKGMIEVLKDSGTIFYKIPYKDQENVMRWLNNGTEIEIIDGPVIREKIEWYEIICDQFNLRGWVISSSVVVSENTK